jgi:selenocysteine-specific elongation factor
MDKKDLAVRATLTLGQRDEILEKLTASGDFVVLPGERLVITGKHFESFKEDLLKKLDELHKAEPLRIGYTALELRKEMKARGELATAALASLTASSSVAMEQDRYRLPSFKVQLDDELSGLAREIEELFLKGRFKTPRPEELSSLVKGRDTDIAKMMQQLIESGVLVKVAPQIVFHRENVEEARRKVITHIEEHGELDSYNFKNLIDSTRKYSIPLLDYFDAVGVTVRGHQHKRYLKK